MIAVENMQMSREVQCEEESTVNVSISKVFLDNMRSITPKS